MHSLGGSCKCVSQPLRSNSTGECNHVYNHHACYTGKVFDGVPVLSGQLFGTLDVDAL